MWVHSINGILENYCILKLNFFLYFFKVKVSHSVMSNSLWPHGLYSPWYSPDQNLLVNWEKWKVKVLWRRRGGDSSRLFHLTVNRVSDGVASRVPSLHPINAQGERARGGGGEWGETRKEEGLLPIPASFLKPSLPFSLFRFPWRKYFKCHLHLLSTTGPPV